jgi:hypothetical protein
MNGYLYTILASSSNPEVSNFLAVGMKGYLYTILAFSSNPEVSIFLRCRNEGIPLYY